MSVRSWARSSLGKRKETGTSYPKSSAAPVDEVAVLGALGCGRRLLDKALADCAANDRHAHAVLHATNAADLDC